MVLKDRGFGAHGEDRGPRLRRQIGCGPTALQRRFVEIEPEAVVRVVRPVAHRDIEWSEPEKPLAGGKRVGRPRVVGVRPWEAAGLSRTEYYRRKKGGVG